MPDPRRHADNRNMLESLLRYIPGFKGYLEKEYRRESDHLARTWLADRLQQAKRDLDRYQRDLVDAGQLDKMTHCERLRTQIDTLENKIRGSVRGYSGFFDYVRVDEAVLDRVYELDMALMKDVESFADTVTALEPEGETGPRELLDHIDEVQQKYNQRGDLLQGLGDAGGP